jgi:general secretion pathway protein D
VVDVEILEVDRSKLMEYGLQLASPPTGSDTTNSPGIDGSAAVDPTNLTARSLRTLTPANVLLSGVPALYYRLLKTDSHTRTLANPHLRMSDGIAATAAFGEKIPTPNATVGAVAAGGVNTVPITSYTYQDIGVNIAVTPRVHADDDVSLALTIELTSVEGTGFGGLPTFGNRKVATTLRLKDGETNILGGLIRDDERFVRDGIPGLTDVPGLDHLFTKNHKEATETDVVVMITPHIIRVLDIADDDLRPLKLSREGSAASLAESSTPSQPTPRDPGPAIDPTTPAAAPANHTIKPAAGGQ